MRHRNVGRKFGREAGQRKALLRGLTDSFFLHGRIETTVARAKELRTVIEPLVTKAKKNDVATRRSLMSYLYTDEAVNRLLTEWGPKNKDRQGGYTRVTKVGNRSNDGAPMAVIEFVD